VTSMSMGNSNTILFIVLGAVGGVGLVVLIGVVVVACVCRQRRNGDRYDSVSAITMQQQGTSYAPHYLDEMNAQQNGAGYVPARKRQNAGEPAYETTNWTPHSGVHPVYPIVQGYNGDNAGQPYPPESRQPF